MARNNTTNDVTFGYRTGGAVDGATGFSGSATDFTCLVTSHNRSYTSKAVSQAGICATDDQMFPTRTNGTETFTCMVPATGYTFFSYQGHYIEITEQILALSATTRTGYVSGWTNSGSDDGNETETITITYGVVGV